MKGRVAVPPTVAWRGKVPGVLEILDQRALPAEERVLRLRSAPEVWDALHQLAVRGAPAIGIAAAYGYVLGLQGERRASRTSLLEKARRIESYLATARPTAVNLRWALRRMSARLRKEMRSKPVYAGLPERLLEEARAIHREDAESCRRIGEFGAALLPRRANILTHCNAGSLATGGEGTALAVVYRAAAAGKRVHVFADETRPLLQGARLTCWELSRRGVGVTLLADSAAASLLTQGRVEAVLVGADRIAANGDVANKVGTYPLAVLAREHRVPFYVAAPLSTFDLSSSSGKRIPIEGRPAEEVSAPFGTAVAPEGVGVFNPAFDITPFKLITCIVTEAGVISAPNRQKIKSFFGRRPIKKLRSARGGKGL